MVNWKCCKFMFRSVSVFSKLDAQNKFLMPVTHLNIVERFIPLKNSSPTDYTKISSTIFY